MRNDRLSALGMRALRQAADRYKSEGYVVSIEPDQVAIPDQLRTYPVDLIARRGDELVVVQVKTSSTPSAAADADVIKGMAQAVRSIPNARLDIISLPLPSLRALDSASAAVQLNVAREVASHHLSAGFLLAWAGLEAALRGVARDVDPVPASAMELASLLYQDGNLTLNQWQLVADMTPIRNAIAHGFEAPRQPTVDDVDAVASLAETLISDERQEALRLVDWFLENFEDPAEHTPHDTSEGGYQYRAGEPHNAADILDEAFPTLSQSIRDEAVEIINGYSTEWVRKQPG